MPRLSHAAIELVAERFRTLGEPTRLRILDALRQRERSVTELVTQLRATQANVSKHLQLLHAAGFVGRRREGTTIYYHVADPGVFELCDLVCGRVSETLDRTRKAIG